jgi:hypothetical protein
MNHTSKLSMVAVAAALAAGGAHAAVLETMVSNNNNSSLVFLAVDSVGTRTSLLVDLNFNRTDFDPLVATASLVGAGQKVVWDFKLDTLTVNGVAQPGTFAWSGQFAMFDAAAQAADTKFGVIAGGNGSTATFLTTGNPTPGNLAAQSGAATVGMTLANGTLNNNNGLGTLVAGNTAGANALVEAIDPNTGAPVIGQGYIPSNSNMGTNLNWQGKLSWQAMVAEGTSSVFYRLRANQGAEIQVGGPFAGTPTYGQFNYNDGVLTWATAALPVPEASSLTLLLAGLGAMGLVIRRRAVR